MSCPRPARFIVVVFAAFAMIVIVGVRGTFAQEAAASGASVDPNWESTVPSAGPAIDEDAETADKVLEIPRVACNKDDLSDSCDSASADNDDDDGQAINAPSPGAPPTLDDDTASSGAPPNDWGDVDEYQNQEVYAAVPYAVYPYSTTTLGTMNRPSIPSPGYVPMSSPITQAARPPLTPGPWMLSPSASMYSRPAGSPMMGMMAGFHH
jgi:hypothetical protein